MAGEGTCGVKFQYSTNAGTSYTNLAHVLDIDGPNGSRDMVDVTDQDSTQCTREFVPGLADEGEVSLTLNNVTTDATQEFMDTLFTATSASYFKILMPTTTNFWTFQGFVNSKGRSFPLGDKIGLNYGVKVTGVVTYTSTT